LKVKWDFLQARHTGRSLKYAVGTLQPSYEIKRGPRGRDLIAERLYKVVEGGRLVHEKSKEEVRENGETLREQVDYPGLGLRVENDFRNDGSKVRRETRYEMKQDHDGVVRERELEQRMDLYDADGAFVRQHHRDFVSRTGSVTEFPGDGRMKITEEKAGPGVHGKPRWRSGVAKTYLQDGTIEPPPRKLPKRHFYAPTSRRVRPETP
jgi:hypothetical protein